MRAPEDAWDVPAAVERLLAAAAAAQASDVHLQPTADALQVRWRIDGVLHEAGCWPQPLAANVVARLKVLADLLTYQTDRPQEGRLRHPGADDASAGAGAGSGSGGTAGGHGVEMRLSTFPTLHGERAALRLFAAHDDLRELDQLDLPADLLDPLRAALGRSSGAVLFTGPAGSGKTTTAYACLRHVAAAAEPGVGGRSILTLEDPIERVLPGVAQSQVRPAHGFTLADGLRSALRQDPEVLLVGEIRDRDTAEGVFQASLTGHLVLSTFHADGVAAALSRLGDFGIEPYLLRSGLAAVFGQRLVRRLAADAAWTDDSDLAAGLPVERFRTADASAPGGGYAGRLPLVEMLPLAAAAVAAAILRRADAAELHDLALAAGMVDRHRRALTAVRAGHTTPREIRRVFGLVDFPAE